MGKAVPTRTPDRAAGRTGCLVAGALFALASLLLYGLGAPVELVRVMLIGAAVYAVAGLFGPMWLRNVLLFEFRAS